MVLSFSLLPIYAELEAQAMQDNELYDVNYSPTPKKSRQRNIFVDDECIHDD